VFTVTVTRTGIVSDPFVGSGARQDAVAAQSLLDRSALGVTQPMAGPGDANAGAIVLGARSHGDAY
jgi:hypothetical protein